MKKLIKLLLICNSIFLLSSYCNAETFLESRKVTRSDFYTGITGKAQLSYISLEDWLTFRKETNSEADTTIADRGFIVDDSVVLAEFYSIANEVLAQWPGTIPKTSMFLKSGSTTAYGGEATKANELLFDVGTLNNTQSHDELAAVIAHELSHILLEHNKKLSYINSATDLFKNYSDVKGFSRNLQAVRVDSTNSGIDFDVVFDADYYNDMEKIQGQQDLAARFYHGIHSSLFSRRNEVEADKLATDLLIRSGFSPLGLKSSFDALKQSYDFNELLSITMLETTQGLMNQYSDEISSYMLDDPKKISKGLGSMFVSIKDKIKDVTVETARTVILERLESSHPVSDKRITSFSDYLHEEYGRRERNKRVKIEPLEDYLNQELVQIVMQNNEHGMDVLQFLASEEIDQANTSLQEIDVRSGFENSFHNYVAYRLYQKTNESEEAAQALLGISSSLKVPNTYAAEFSGFLLENSPVESVVQVSQLVRVKEGFFGIVPDFYPVKIRLAKISGDDELAESLGRECMKNHSDMENLYYDCMYYAEIDNIEPRQSRGMFGIFSEIGSSLNGDAESVN